MRELGWLDGRTVAIEYRWAEGRSERFAEIVAEFVRLKVDVIVAIGAAAATAREATSVIPIVFPIAADPVGSGFVGSLARPGGNITGLSLQQTDVVGKRLELLREVIPDLRRLAIMGNIGGSGAVLEMREAQVAARTLNLGTVALEIQRSEDIAPAFDSLNGRADALYIVGDPLTTTNRMRISTTALGLRLPTMSINREFVEAEVSCPMDLTSRTYGGAPPNM
jgi:putative tryptophan/tyrosine transport system substrate-binding protein